MKSGSKISSFLICPGVSCSRDGNDDFQALYISKLKLEVQLRVFVFSKHENDHVREYEFVRMNLLHALAQDKVSSAMPRKMVNR